MTRRQRERSGATGPQTVLLLAAWLGSTGCSLETSGIGDHDARPDTTDADVPPVDGDADDDGPSTDVPQCRIPADCGNLSCADGWLDCVGGRCVPMAANDCPGDDILCSRDFCPGGTNACQRIADPNRCTPGYPCDLAYGCVTRTPCSSDTACDDGIACTFDRCAPGGTFCIHDPEDADGDTVGGNYGWIEAQARYECPGGDCNDEDPAISPDHAEVCGNGLDDDCDGLADYADPDSTCATLPQHDTCETALPLVVSDRVTLLQDDTTGVAAQALNSWCIIGSTFDGPPAYFSLNVEYQAEVVIDTKDAGFDTVLSLFQGCGGGAPELICNDDRNHVPAAGSRFVQRYLNPGLYVVRVAGRVREQSGPFTLHYSVQPAGGSASCDSPVDATDGGTFIGRLSDPGGTLGEHLDRGSCVDELLTGLGDQERFVIRPAGAIDLFANSVGTPFRHALYLRGGDCTAFLVDDACTQGVAGTGTTLDWPAWAGTAYITLDWIPPLTSGGNPDQLYTLLILP